MSKASDSEKMAAYPRKLGRDGWRDLPDRHPCLISVGPERADRRWRVAVWCKHHREFRLVSGGQTYAGFDPHIGAIRARPW